MQNADCWIFVVSNSIWKGGEIVPVWGRPFDMIAVANRPGEGRTGGAGPKNSLNENWLPFVGNYRTFLNSLERGRMTERIDQFARCA
jgi:hypothetical protein